MHVLGKILAWFVVVGALVAIPLAARVHEVRKEWHTSLVKKKEDFTKKSGTVREKRKTLNDLEIDVTRASTGWGLVWDNVEIRVEFERDDVGEIAWHDNGKQSDEREVYEQKIRIVTNDGQTPGMSRPGNAAAAGNKTVFSRVGRNEGTIYAFQVAEDGNSSVFIGSFSRAEAAPANVKEWKKPNWNLRAGDRMWKPNWRVQAGEMVENWQRARWRLRTLAPPLGLNRFVALSGELTDAQQQIRHKQLEEQIKQDVKAMSDVQERLREYELEGQNPAFKNFKGQLPGYMIDGLIDAIVKAEEERNRSLEVVDQLRRELKANHDRAVRLRKENTTLGRSLPGSSRATKVSRK